MTRILIIDDETVNHQLVARALMPLQCEIHYAENGKGGISQARAVKPDSIITDVMMSDINCYEVKHAQANYFQRRDGAFVLTLTQWTISTWLIISDTIQSLHLYIEKHPINQLHSAGSYPIGTARVSSLTNYTFRPKGVPSQVPKEPN